MTGWRIEPDGLNRILTETDTAVQAVRSALEGPADSIGEVQAAAGYDGIVAGAYAAFLQETYDGPIARMFERYAAALEGTANAANAYLAGDEQIAGTIATGISASDFDAAIYAQRSTGASGAPGGGGGGGGW
jgi:hypothetical protein